MTSIRQEIRRLTLNGPAPFTAQVTVESVRSVSEGFRRVTVQGADLAAYTDIHPADAFKIMIPPDGRGPVDFPQRGGDGLPYWPDGARPPLLRAFTVRTYEPARRRLRFDVAVHGAGLTRTWLEAVRPGDVIGLSGMRREFAPGDVDRHVLIGDGSAVPAMAAIIEALDPGVPATVHVAVEHAADLTLLPRPPHVTVRPVHGSGRELAAAVREREAPGGRTQAWLAAEAATVRELRRHLLTALGVARDDLHAAAYWKAGADATAVDDETLRAYQAAAAEGADVMDPDVADKIAFGDGEPGVPA